MKKLVKDAVASIGAHISDGNMKIGSIGNWSLTPGRTCSTEACSTCLTGGCYALKAYRQYPGTRKAWDENSECAEKNVAGLEKVLDLYFHTVKPMWFRVHVAGDFVSREYAEMWARVAAKAPETRFLAFSKQWENIRGVEFPENFSLVLSGWPGTEIPADLAAKYSKAYCVNSAEEVPEGGLLCPGSCENCNACWGLAKMGVNAYFVKH